jgi:[protein-PII] uridylyltransferase
MTVFDLLVHAVAWLSQYPPARGRCMIADILSPMEQSLRRMRGSDVSYGAPWEVMGRLCAVMDDLVRALHEEHGAGDEESDMALVAVGGYGRRELTPWSDLDLMFLCRETGSQHVLHTVFRILHALWDLHLEVGHSVRTLEDCVEVSRRDLRTWTALMDARFLAGDRELFRAFEGRMREQRSGLELEASIKRLAGNVWERHRNYARTPFLVEPHVKEGPGGLRDVQSALWLARCRFPVADLENLAHHALISQDESEEIRAAHAFLWRVRLELHRLAGREEDQLTFDLQEGLARCIPVDEEISGLPVEAFMRHYYRHATRIRYFVEEMIAKVTDPSLASGARGPSFVPRVLGEGFLVLGGRLTLLDERVFDEDPPRIMEAVAFAHREGLALDLFTRDQIKLSLHLVDDAFRASERVCQAFLSALDTEDCGYAALELMHRVGLLQGYIPEFGRVSFQVQHDAYHAYTVDVHSLEAVAELGKMRRKRAARGAHLCRQVARRVENWIPLVLGVFLHDVGKGEGSGHAQRGAEIVDALLGRWRLPAEDRERAVFLVRAHILLMDTALGRDLTEERVIAELCRTVGSVARLNELYLMTIADLRATGPDLITDWKDQLLRELYLKSKRLLETGELASPQATQKIDQARALVLSALRGHLPAGEPERWVQRLPGRYLLTTPAGDLAAQVLMAVGMAACGERLRVRHQRGEGCEEILVCTWDAPALFSRICGVLVANGFNILGARIHTWANGVVMDSFQVEGLGGTVDGDRMERFSRDLEAVLEGKETLDRLLCQRAPSPHAGANRHPALRPRVKIDNRTSDFHTIVEIRARDQFGLLFAVTGKLAELGLSIHLALIDTRRGQVMDVFYVLEATGQKVTGQERLGELERALYRTLERMEASSPPWMAGG